MPDDLLSTELAHFNAEVRAEATGRLRSMLDPSFNVGDLLNIDYSEATILVHDALRQAVQGIPLGSFLLCTRLHPDSTDDIDPNAEDASLLLMRVVGKAKLPNQSETDQARLLATQRSIDSDEHWDSLGKTDQYTLNILHMAGLSCRVLGTFRMRFDGHLWRLAYASDISNFYSGRGMKVYKPHGSALEAIVNFHRGEATDAHTLHGHPVPVGRLRYASSEPLEQSNAFSVRVALDPADMLARRTALFGMTRTGKSNTTKTIAASVFRLRARESLQGRVGQLIFDVNGEYANDNPQDSGCLRNVWCDTPNATVDDVRTYGTTPHPNDPERRIVKINFYGSEPDDWQDHDAITSALEPLFVGKAQLNELLANETSRYIIAFRDTGLEPPRDLSRGPSTRYRRAISVYRALLHGAGFPAPSHLRTPNVGRLFSQQLRQALANAQASNEMQRQQYARAAEILQQNSPTWDEYVEALRSLAHFIGVTSSGPDQAYTEFNREYGRQNQGRIWHDDTISGLLSLLEYRGGIRAIRAGKELHYQDAVRDYAAEISEELRAGKLVIVDQSTGEPEFNRAAADRIAKYIFASQKADFVNPEVDDQGRPFLAPDVLIYAEEAHTLLPRERDSNLSSIWSRLAKEGAKYRLGMFYATQEPSSVQRNILSNTENWFIAHLNNQDELRTVSRYYDFSDFAQQIAQVPEPGFIRMRTLSNPYTVPVQVDRFTANSG
jgi:hypothetical protein